MMMPVEEIKLEQPQHQHLQHQLPIQQLIM